MLKISDKKFFCEVVADTIAQTYLNYTEKDLRDQWINAFAQAAAILEDNIAFLHWNPHEKILLIWSPETNKIYRSSGDFCCRCPASNNIVSEPCHHRAMSLLVESYYELQRKPDDIARIDFADAIFFDEKLCARRKVELLDLCILEERAELTSRVEALRKHFAKTASKNPAAK